MIPVNEPLLNGREKELLAECIDTGWVSSDGPFVRMFEMHFANYIGTKHGIAVCYGTAALETALFAAGVGKGDEAQYARRRHLKGETSVWVRSPGGIPPARAAGGGSGPQGGGRRMSEVASLVRCDMR